ncbi:hypothetical protein F66182_833 [Fusarium sp. NRRL 66182]|nr:hypothetical protein F66182_833 [Fusarium sp. NRRL 66182]
MELMNHLLFAVALLLPVVSAVDPTVDLGYSKYKGTNLGNGVSQWVGIRYAAPPLKNLRFELPQEPIRTRTVQDASSYGAACIATGTDPAAIGSSQSEDCLFINVWAPAHATSQDKLPVYFYIQGGGFNSNGNARANGTQLVQTGHLDMVVVTFNYRVGVYGFLNDGAAVTPNIGLHDQRKGLQWVQRHISKFGGNPKHVVIGGDSAGAASVSLHLSAFGGKNEGLFHGAAAQSVSFGTLLTVKESVYQYKNLADRLGCSGTNEAILACIRSKSAQEIRAVDANLPLPGGPQPPLYMWTVVLDNSLVPDVTYRLFEQGRFIQVPLITGDDTNGGTGFAPRNANTVQQSNDFLKSQFPFSTTEQLAQLQSLYPNQNDTCPNRGCYWRQISDVYGDMRYMCPGLYISNSLVSNGVARSWNYRYNVEDPAQVAEGLGVPHVVENHAIFGPGLTSSNPPASYLEGQINAPVAPVIQSYWTSFVRSLDPNTHRHPSSVKWEPWTAAGKQRVVFETGGETRMETPSQDLQKKCTYISSIGPSIRQ